MPKSIQEIVDFYTPYLMGALDTLILLCGVMSAVDQKQVLRGIVLSIARDASAQAREEEVGHD